MAMGDKPAEGGRGAIGRALRGLTEYAGMAYVIAVAPQKTLSFSSHSDVIQVVFVGGGNAPYRLWSFKRVCGSLLSS